MMSIAAIKSAAVNPLEHSETSTENVFGRRCSKNPGSQASAAVRWLAEPYKKEGKENKAARYEAVARAAKR